MRLRVYSQTQRWILFSHQKRDDFCRAHREHPRERPVDVVHNEIVESIWRGTLLLDYRLWIKARRLTESSQTSKSLLRCNDAAPGDVIVPSPYVLVIQKVLVPRFQAPKMQIKG